MLKFIMPFLFAIVVIFTTQPLFAQYGTKGIIELERGEKIKPQKIDSKTYVILGHEDISPNPNTHLRRTVKVFDEKSKEVRTEQYENQGKNYRIVSREYNDFGDLIRKIENSDDRPEKITILEYEYDSLKNWVVKKEFVLRDTLKFKYCLTREIDYREEKIEEYRDTILGTKSVVTNRCYGPVKAIYENPKQLKQSECGKLDRNGVLKETLVSPNFSEIEYKTYSNGDLTKHEKSSYAGSNTRREFFLRSKISHLSFDTLQTDNGIEIFKKIEENGKVLSESHICYNKNGDMLSQKTVPTYPYTYRNEIAYQYLKYNKEGEWIQKIMIKEGKPYFLIEREIVYQTHLGK
ncbi:MAG: hypothetical protein ACI85O_000525 [Saprospiraceae bacterium]|jgi:hypothetical protein